MKTFRLPDLGEGLSEAEIVAWHISAGDHVVADQPLVSVETAKAVVEIPSPHAGVIAGIHGEPGDILQVGEELVDFVEEGERADRGAIVGELPGAAGEEEAGAAGEEVRPPTRRARAGAARATPAVRALARRLGVDLAHVAGTGPDGAITAKDVERAGEELAAGTTVRPLRGVRRAMAQAMARSGAEIVPATLTDEVDVDHWPEAGDPTIRLVRAIIAGCAAEPTLNAWYDSDNELLRLHRRIDLGIAVDTPEGLFAPVLRDVANRSEDDLRQGLEAMKADVAARTVAPEELRGPTFTLSNFGMLCGRHAALAIVPPQVAILGAGRIAPQVLAVDGKPAVRRVLPLSLTFDHRVISGGEAARFLAAAMDALAQAD